MSFEDKKIGLATSLEAPATRVKPQAESRRISKSYTLKQEIADLLAERAFENDLTASRYLEKLLTKELNK